MSYYKMYKDAEEETIRLRKELAAKDQEIADLKRKGSSCSRCMARDMDELYGYNKR
jgi:hypothetical protein